MAGMRPTAFVTVLLVAVAAGVVVASESPVPKAGGSRDQREGNHPRRAGDSRRARRSRGRPGSAAGTCSGSRPWSQAGVPAPCRVTRVVPAAIRNAEAASVAPSARTGTECCQYIVERYNVVMRGRRPGALREAGSR